jgi:hypothetical protein
MTEQSPALGEAGEDEGGLVIIEERSGPATRRWVRFVIPVMVEVDCDDDTVTPVVTLPEEIRDDRDDRGHFCVYDEKFIRRHDDDQPQTHARCVAGPRWEYDHLRARPPVNWSKSSEWEEVFDLIEADDEYAEVHPYAEPRY